MHYHPVHVFQSFQRKTRWIGTRCTQQFSSLLPLSIMPELIENKGLGGARHVWIVYRYTSSLPSTLRSQSPVNQSWWVGEDDEHEGLFQYHKDLFSVEG